MQDYIYFITEHWLLCSAFVVVLILFILNEVLQQQRGAPKCNAQQVVQMMNHENATVIDLRDKADFRNGHIIDAKNIPITDIKKASAQLDKTKSIILVCANGQTSEKTAAQLKADGFTTIHCLRGGMNGWRANSMPVVK